MDIFRKGKNYFALSFSDHQLQLAQADKKGKLRSYAKQVLTPGIIVRGRIRKKEALSQALTEFLKASKLKLRFVAVGLPEIQAFTRVLTLPFLPTDELDDAVRWEAEPLLPFSLDKAYLDWMILEKLKKGVRILVVALPQNLVEDYAQVLEELGFQPVAFEITSLSLARNIEKDGVAAMIIELKEKEAVLVIVGPKGGIEVSSTLSFEDKQRGGEELLATIEKLLAFYQKKRVGKDKEKKIAKIVVCGEGAKGNWPKVIGEKTSLKTEILQTQPPHLASALSLARKDVAAPIDEKTINLIPPRIQGLYDQATKVREISAWLKFSLLALFLALFGYSSAYAYVYFETKKIESQTIRLQASISPEAAEKVQEAQKLNTQAQKVVSLAGSQIEVVPLFSLIRKAAPAGVLITHVSYDGEKNLIFVNGLADHRGNLLAFRDQLEKTDQFSQVLIPLSHLGKEANVAFSVSIAAKKEKS